MYKKTQNILITGKPGVGKTTLIIGLTRVFGDLNPQGFYTEEIRKGGKRKGFVIKGLDGKERGLLAHVDISSPYRVGKYSVDLKGFERFLSGLKEEIFTGGIILIDEIGKMECFSTKFKEIVKNCLLSDIPLIATVSERGGGFIEEVKRRDDVYLLTITIENRGKMLSMVKTLLECK